MTKNELKQKYTEWNRQITALDQKQKEIFQELQDLCQEKGDGKRWCCLEKLVETLVKAGEGYRPLQLAREYHVIEGQKEALRNFAIATNNFDAHSLRREVNKQNKAGLTAKRAERW